MNESWLVWLYLNERRAKEKRRRGRIWWGRERGDWRGDRCCGSRGDEKVRWVMDRAI